MDMYHRGNKIFFHRPFIVDTIWTIWTEKYKDAFFQPTQIFYFSKVSYASTLHQCVSYSTMNPMPVLYLPIKSLRFPFPLSFDYFNEPCTTAVVKKTGTPNFVRTLGLWFCFFFFVN